MKNLILQYWTGPLPEWARLAMKSIELYAKDISADYQLVSGWPLGEFRGTVSQKICLVKEEYDSYDNVLMLDTDMVYSGIADNAFQYDGIGRYHLKAMSSHLSSKQGRYWPRLYKQGSPLFFGNFIKLNREQRITLRAALPNEEFVSANKSDPRLSRFNTSMPPNDEQTLHYMIHTSGMTADNFVPHNRFCDLPEESHSMATLMHFCNDRKNNIINYINDKHQLKIL